MENRLANEQLSKPPKVSTEFMTFWLHRFRKLDVTKQSHRKMLIDTFINAIYLYDDKMLITFNYKDGTKKITFSDIQGVSKQDASGSDLDCSPAPSAPELRLRGFFVFWRRFLDGGGITENGGGRAPSSLFFSAFGLAYI